MVSEATVSCPLYVQEALSFGMHIVAIDTRGGLRSSLETELCCSHRFPPMSSTGRFSKLFRGLFNPGLRIRALRIVFRKGVSICVSADERLLADSRRRLTGSPFTNYRPALHLVAACGGVAV